MNGEHAPDASEPKTGRDDMRRLDLPPRLPVVVRGHTAKRRTRLGRAQAGRVADSPEPRSARGTIASAGGCKVSEAWTIPLCGAIAARTMLARSRLTARHVRDEGAEVLRDRLDREAIQLAVVRLRESRRVD